MEIPLRDRIYHVSSSAKVLQSTTARPVSHKNWDEKSITAACQAVREGKLSQRRAAEVYGIPRSTLGDHCRGKVLPGARCGTPKYLTDAEESELVRFLVRCAEIGYPKSRKCVIALVQTVCNKKGLKVTVSHGWWESFSRRHAMVVRIPAKVSVARAKASDPVVISTYFDMYEKVLVEYDLFDKPNQIFNMDETGMPLEHRPTKVVIKKGMKHPCCVTSGKKTNITVVGCVNAGGHCIPPMVIWNVKTMHSDMAAGEVRGTLHAFSSNGWIDQELFDIWFNNLFLLYAPSVRPLLLLMDGHSTHYCPETIRAAAKQKVILFTLPPNTTHICQPLDKGVFGPLKARYFDLCQEYMAKNPGKVVSRFSFSSILKKAWYSSLTMENIQSGFETTGIYPMDRSKVIPLEYQEDSFAEFSDDANDGLPYLPMLTPSRKRASGASHIRRQTLDTVDTSKNYTYATMGRPLQDILQYPEPLSKLPTTKPKASSRVITGEEHQKYMEDQAIRKVQQAYSKEEKKHVRETKKGKAGGMCTVCRSWLLSLVAMSCL